MFDPDVIGSITDIYSLIGLGILALVYTLGFLLTRNIQKKQHIGLMSNYDKNNQRVVDKLDELINGKNTLDLQSSMDIFSVFLSKSMENVMEEVRKIIEENHIEEKERSGLILEKLNDIVNSQYNDSILLLGRIYLGSTVLSSYMCHLNKDCIIKGIHEKIPYMKNEKYFKDCMDFIRREYSHAIADAQVDMSEKNK